MMWVPILRYRSPIFSQKRPFNFADTIAKCQKTASLPYQNKNSLASLKFISSASIVIAEGNENPLQLLNTYQSDRVETQPLGSFLCANNSSEGFSYHVFVSLFSNIFLIAVESISNKAQMSRQIQRFHPLKW